MTLKECIGLLLALVFLVPRIAFPEALKNFSGKWENTENVAGSGNQYSDFDLSLIEDDAGKLNGSYCFVTQYGSRIDCSSGGVVNINGHATAGSPKKAIVNFDSFSGEKTELRNLRSMVMVRLYGP
jgi:hypothetical protein